MTLISSFLLICGTNENLVSITTPLNTKRTKVLISFAAWVLDLALETYTNFIQRSHVLDILFAALIFATLQSRVAALACAIA